LNFCCLDDDGVTWIIQKGESSRIQKGREKDEIGEFLEKSRKRRRYL
jgi:hypothetical protein